MPSTPSTDTCVGAAWKVALPVIILLAAFGACRGPAGPQDYVFTGATMGTTYTVKVVSPSPLDEARQTTIHQAIDAAAEDVNRKMSTFRKDSELSRFNQAPETTPFKVSADTLAVFQMARKISAESGGAFDITVGPLVNAWGFGPEKRTGSVGILAGSSVGDGPTEEQLAALRARVGYEKVEIDAAASTIRKTRPDVYCDLSAIAKGYGVDKVAAALEDLGYLNYMVEIGGEVRAKGRKADGSAWRIGIEQPITEGRAVARVVELRDLALATSGDYRNYFEKNGVRLSHEIDPHTGRPITHKLASVSVITEECAIADGYATALIVMGPEAGFELASKLGLAVLFLIHDGADGFVEKTTPAFDAIVKPEV